MLDADGVCCASGTLDACGVCDGTAFAVDAVGTCCATGYALDAAGVCCTHASGVDVCGVCGGNGDTCASVLSMSGVFANPATSCGDSVNLLSTAGKAFVSTFSTWFLAAFGGIPASQLVVTGAACPDGDIGSSVTVHVKVLPSATTPSFLDHAAAAAAIFGGQTHTSGVNITSFELAPAPGWAAVSCALRSVVVCACLTCAVIPPPSPPLFFTQTNSQFATTTSAKPASGVTRRTRRCAARRIVLTGCRIAHVAASRPCNGTYPAVVCSPHVEGLMLPLCVSATAWASASSARAAPAPADARLGTKAPPATCACLGLLI